MSDDAEVVVDPVEAGDEEMGEADAEATAAGVEEPSGLENIEPMVEERIGFLDYLRSPIVEIVVGTGADATSIYAHQRLLTQSSFFEQQCASFTASTRNRRITLADDDLNACSAVLEWLYKSDYFPNVSGQSLEYDSTAPSPDDEGVALLRHARVYTLAKRFQLPELAALAHRKIHLTASTAKGEIAYARFVYRETASDDAAIRRPVAQFWATRSHVLRHEAEQEFKRMCLEFPQFGFDVLSLVLDQQEKKTAKSETTTTNTGPGRKRQRMSGM